MSSGSTRTGPSPPSKSGLKKRRSIGRQSWTKGRRKASTLDKNCRANGGTNDPPNALGDPNQLAKSICGQGSSAIARQLALSPMMIFAIGIKYSLDVVIYANPREPDHQHHEACLGFGYIAAISRHAFSP